ncbi:MAG: 16S rRNA (cytosine(1402)-N(4))-methyltransferase [Candidatus Marinimicrobia bacterium]|nr:16S rRNA (cytosine(1402)-N(4))-methyltransferase [Candidatus Neomarinimicrobiota bacterium]
MKNLQELINVHIPVMSTQVLEYLNIQPDGFYIDGTIGAGGHATQILSKLSSEGKLIGIDRDAEVLEICYQRFRTSSDQISLHHSSYHNLPKIMGINGLSKVNGILLDLGLSSLQINSENRGFSFQSNAPADMRFDQTKGQTAEELIRKSSEQELADIIFLFGEERKSKRISNSIKKIKNLSTTMDLKEAIRKSTPPHHRNKTHARVFQAIRIAVNNEIDKLKSFLKIFLDYLEIGGRLVVISYHSIEDRIVKHSFRQLKNESKIELLTRKPLTPSIDEIKLNKRSRSAKMRALEKVS